MKHEEAKFILSAYRPNGADASDATFCTAVDQTRHDPALGKWFELEQKFDRFMTTKLGEVQPPPGLRAAILAGSKVSVPSAPARTWWRQPAILAAAASVAVVLTAAALFLFPARADARGLSDFAMLDSVHEELHHGAGADNAALQASLQNPSCRLCEGVAVNFSRLKATGCRTLQFSGRDVLEVCFERNGRWFHCYIARRSGFSHVASAPEFTSRGSQSCATWSDSRHVFVVVSNGNADALKQLL